jgi:hypothetical protein
MDRNSELETVRIHHWIQIQIYQYRTDGDNELGIVMIH